MKAHIETINDVLVVTIGDTKFALTETSVCVQSDNEISVRTAKSLSKIATERSQEKRIGDLLSHIPQLQRVRKQFS